MLKKLKEDSEAYHAIVKTIRNPVVGEYSACYDESRLDRISEDARPPPQIRRSRRLNNPILQPPQKLYKIYDKQELLKTSFSLNDFLHARETGIQKYCAVHNDAVTRRVLMQEVLRETPIKYTMARVLSSQWLNDNEIIYGTSGQSVFTYNLKKRNINVIRSFGNNDEVIDIGVRAIKFNSNRTLIAFNGYFGNELAIYKMPNLEQLCIGEEGHYGALMDILWLDEETIITAGRDTRLAVWNVNKPFIHKSHTMYPVMQPSSFIRYNRAENVVSLCYNKTMHEIAALSFDGSIQLFHRHTLQKKFFNRINMFFDKQSQILWHDSGFYAVNCQDFLAFYDTRSLKLINIIEPVTPDMVIKSISFQGNLMTTCTENGLIYFYDITAERFLESQKTNSYLALQCCKDSMIEPDIVRPLHPPAIFTHCYDSTGTRIFVGGGSALYDDILGYAAIFH